MDHGLILPQLRFALRLFCRFGLSSFGMVFSIPSQAPALFGGPTDSTSSAVNGSLV